MSNEAWQRWSRGRASWKVNSSQARVSASSTLGTSIGNPCLDNNKDRWLQAIEADELSWHHVSDLKGWSNEVAKMYGVRSIPHTVLLDAEGKVMARNLRGEALAQKLGELFGEKVEGQGK